MFLQDLWIDGLNWDEPLNEQHRANWQSISLALDGVDSIKVPRWLSVKKAHPGPFMGFQMPRNGHIVLACTMSQKQAHPH